MALVPLNLLVSHNGKSKRQHITCVYKCGDACSKPVRNTSDNEYFGDVVKALSRRSMLQAGGIAVLAVGAGSALAACGTDEQPGRPGHPDVIDGARRDAAGHEVRLGRTQQRGRRRRRRRLPAGGGDQLGRPGAAERAEVRRRQSERRRSARPVRLQQRLRRAPACPGTAEPLPVGDQLRVRQPAVHVPRLQPRRPDPRAVRHRDRRDRHGRRRGRAHAGGTQAGDGSLQPAHHRRHPDDADRPRRGNRLREDRRRPGRPDNRRHLRQLCRRRDPMGHSAFR